MDAKINDFSCFLEKGENVRKYCIYNIKRGSEHLKHHGKSTQNRYKFDAGKKYVKCKGNVPKMEAKWEPKSGENRKHMRKIYKQNL